MPSFYDQKQPNGTDLKTTSKDELWIKERETRMSKERDEFTDKWDNDVSLITVKTATPFHETDERQDEMSHEHFKRTGKSSVHKSEEITSSRRRNSERTKTKTKPKQEITLSDINEDDINVDFDNKDIEEELRLVSTIFCFVRVTFYLFYDYYSCSYYELS